MRRRTYLTTAAGLGATLLAGCSGGDSDGGDGDSTTGSFRLMISDQPAAIGDFDSLDVSLSSARVFRAGDDEELTSAVVNGTTPAPGSTPTGTTGDDTAEDGAGFVEFDLDGVAVDLTQVTGDRAVSVLEDEIDPGRYSGIELRVASVEGVVDDGAVDVMVPGNRLRIARPFEVGANEEMGFVFDINVVKKGRTGDYTLLPVIGKSGVAGSDVEVEEVDAEE